MKNSYGKVRGTYYVTNARARPASTGYIKVVFTIHRNRYSNAWMMKVSLSKKTLRYYPYRATFDFECFFTGNNLPADTKTLQWSARHVPLSVSLASNVPGHAHAQCYVTDGDSDKLLGAMMSGLVATSDAAFASLLPSYEDVLDELNARKHAWEEETKEE